MLHTTAETPARPKPAYQGDPTVRAHPRRKTPASADEDEDPPDEPPAPFVTHSLSPWLTMYAPLACAAVAWFGVHRAPDIPWPPWVIIAGLTICLVGISDSLVPILFSGLAVLAWGAATKWETAPTIDPVLVEILLCVSFGGLLAGMFMTAGTRYEIRPGAITIYRGPFRGRETIPVKSIGITLLPRGPRQWLLISGDVQLDLGGRKLILKDVLAPSSVEGRLHALGY